MTLKLKILNESWGIFVYFYKVMLSLNSIQNKRIVIAPLNWGMGHVSRCIALIEKLKYKNKLVIACNSEQRNILEQYHPNIEFEMLEGYPFNFDKNKRFIGNIVRQFGSLSKHIKKDNLACKRICEKWRIDLVISDHRYGFFNKDTTSIFLTHQVKLPLPWYLNVANKLHKNYISNFSTIWIIDTPKIKLAGKLSQKVNYIPSYYIGLLSRFEFSISSKKDNKVFLLVSGPSAYWDQLCDKFNGISFSGIIGPLESEYLAIKLSIPFYDSADWKQTDKLIQSCKTIYGYAGYSTIMDIHFLKCNSNLKACQGQFEQEYLEALHY